MHPAPLSLSDLASAAESGAIDTVIVALSDRDGWLMGKRFDASFFWMTRPSRAAAAASISSPLISRWSSLPAMITPTGLSVNPLYWNAQDTENRTLDVLLGGPGWTITPAADGCVSGTIDFQVPEGLSVGSVENGTSCLPVSR